MNYKRSLQDLESSATRRRSKLMAVVLSKNGNNVDGDFRPCPSGLCGDHTLFVIVS
ncbi:MAG: hypothetical protein KTR16_13410 [Acidiferrobacterales bacterium]|nr:hypothetical protein [Acidiferrobacterales bacterium]